MAPLQLVAGHEHGLSVYDTQPSKFAAIEGHWQSYQGRAPLILVAWPDQKNEKNLYEIKIPEIGSFVATGSWNGAITGLLEFPPEDRPPVAIVFWAFRIMVGIGILMILFGLIGGLAAWTGWIGRMRWFYPFLVLMMPSGFVAVLAGWIVAEVGRQPYTVYGLLRTADSVSPVDAGQVALSLMVFIIVYAIVFTAGVFYIWRIAAQGPVSDAKPPPSAPKPERKETRESFKALDELREDIEDATKETARGNA